MARMDEKPGRDQRMKAIEVSRNGQKLYTAGLERGIVDARLLILSQVDPMWFECRGQTGVGHIKWSHLPVSVGDEFTLRVVEVDPKDCPQPP
jgi:hypothetical protein